MRGCFVTATGTGVGKTVLAAAIVAGARARGIAARPLKPILSGLAEPADPAFPHDHELLARAAGLSSAEVSRFTFDPPVSPHLAAALSGRHLAPEEVAGAVRAAARPGELLVVEGVGGLLVPLAADFLVADLAAALHLPLVVAASPGLGTINHTLLTLEAARARGLGLTAVVLTPWPAEPGLIERSNRETIAALGEVEVATLPRVPDASPPALTRAAAALPLDRWLAGWRAGGEAELR